VAGTSSERPPRLRCPLVPTTPLARRDPPRFQSPPCPEQAPLLTDPLLVPGHAATRPARTTRATARSSGASPVTRTGHGHVDHRELAPLPDGT
jgi:hypothetical protein